MKFREFAWLSRICSETNRADPGSYGTLARYRDVRRLEKIGEHTILGGSGDLSDFQTVLKYVKELT